MFYVIYCIDKPEHNEVRLQYRQEHRSWLESQADSGVHATGSNK